MLGSNQPPLRLRGSPYEKYRQDGTCILGCPTGGMTGGNLTLRSIAVFLSIKRPKAVQTPHTLEKIGHEVGGSQIGKRSASTKGYSEGVCGGTRHFFLRTRYFVLNKDLVQL
jgi:hypothetical protein